eukprot:9040400-Karenia_brevis.AAC.1
MLLTMAASSASNYRMGICCGSRQHEFSGCRQHCGLCSQGGRLVASCFRSSWATLHGLLCFEERVLLFCMRAMPFQ